MAEPPRYVVVVHGIGQQRAGETLLPVVQRIAEARRQPQRRPAVGNPLTLPALVAASGAGFSEFAAIPRRRPATLPGGPWRPEPAEPQNGDNLRFVDLCWADLPRADFPRVGQDFAGWSAGLVARVEQDDRARGWIRDLLIHLRAGLVPVQALLALRAKSVAKTVFDDFLGDVQLYAEHAPTRGRAVRRFHDVLAQIDAQHPGERPRYTILAHSLGTVLALDAICFAHANVASRRSVGPAADRTVHHLPGYQDGRELPAVDWAQRVDNLVTLGSPIDKFLLLWPEGWRAMARTDWLDGEFVARRAAPIRHANYCDEQDPVGHELDVARSTPVVRSLFASVEDRVYARYVTPGVAHTDYWQDDALFRRIVDIAIDGREPDQAAPVRWFSNRAFFLVLVVTYVAVPVTGWVLATVACAYLLSAIHHGDLTGTMIPLLACIGIVAATLWLGHLMVMWRQVLHLKRVRPIASPSRTLWRWLFRAMLFGTPPLWLLAAIHCARADDGLCKEPLLQAATVLATIVSSALLVSYLAVRNNWRTLRQTRAQSFGDGHPHA